MRLIRFGSEAKATPGLMIDDRILDLRRIFPEIPDISEAFFRDGWIDRVADVAEPGEPVEASLLCPIHNPSKIVCLGKNYAEHAKEVGSDSPEKPLLFCKTRNALAGPLDPILLPESSRQVDWEVELALIIGKEGKRIHRDDAFDYIAGYTVMNDVSGRDAQFGDDQWYRGKSFDTFAPMGPAIVTPDELGDVGNLRLTATVNGETMQDGNTRDLIFDIPYIVEYLSRDITLLPGDVISTGTPAGVGISRNPPVLLRDGDVVACTVEGIGTISNPVVAD